MATTLKDRLALSRTDMPQSYTANLTVHYVHVACLAAVA